MSDLELRASDDERETTVTQLREHSAAGRLSLEEFAERMTAAYAARTRGELERLTHDLPAATAAPTPRRPPTRLLFALFGSTERDGRIRVRRRALCLMGFGNIDLDLRQATLEGETITIVAIGLFGAIDVYVPEGVESDARGLALFGHARANGADRPPAPGTPLVRVRVLSLFAGIDLWRVPPAWTKRTWREVIDGIRKGEHRELEP